MHRIYTALLLVLLMVPAGAVRAQEITDAPVEPFIPKPGDTPPENLVDAAFDSCFDYYRFGSTPILIESQLATVAQGSPVSFSGKVTNENPYPITDASIYAKVFYRANPSEKSSFGPEVVDSFLVQDGLTLTAGEVYPFTVEWTVPQDASLGEYQIVTFVSSHDRFNLLGLSFSTDIVGGGAKFIVVGYDIGNTRFDITKSTLGGQVVRAATFAPRIEVTEEGLPVTVTLRNTTPARSEGIVHWRLYAWDGLRADKLIHEKEELVTVEAGQSLPITYNITHDTEPVYYLLAEYAPKNETSLRSIHAIRFTNSGVQTPRLNFVGTSAFPAEKGAKAFACVHSAGTAAAENVRVEVKAVSNNLLDLLLFRSVLGKNTYEGRVPGSINALSAPLSRASDSFTVKAKIYQDGTLVDEVTVSYDCSMSTEGCKPPIILTLLALLILGGLVWYLRKKRQSSSPAPQASTSI